MVVGSEKFCSRTIQELEICKIQESKKSVNVDLQRATLYCLRGGLLLAAMWLTGNCIAFSIISDVELSIPPQEREKRERFLQLNLISGENEFAVLNVGGYNESGAAFISAGAVNRSAMSGLNLGLVNQTLISGLNVGLYNETASSALQLGLINFGWSYVSIAPVNVGAGIQIGLINTGSSAIQLGLINFCEDWILPFFAYCRH